MIRPGSLRSGRSLPFAVPPTSCLAAARVSSHASMGLCPLVQSHKEPEQDACSSATRSVPSSPAPAKKKPRVATPSPLPTFKVCTDRAAVTTRAIRDIISSCTFNYSDTAFDFQLNMQFGRSFLKKNAIGDRFLVCYDDRSAEL